MFPTFWRWSWVHYCLPYNLQVLSVRKVDVQVNIRSSPPTVWSSLISLLHLLFSFSSWAYQNCIITRSVLFSWLQALGLWCYDLSNHYLCSIISTISFFLMSKTKFSSKSMEVCFFFFPLWSWLRTRDTMLWYFLPVLWSHPVNRPSRCPSQYPGLD